MSVKALTRNEVADIGFGDRRLSTVSTVSTVSTDTGDTGDTGGKLSSDSTNKRNAKSLATCCLARLFAW